MTTAPTRFVIQIAGPPPRKNTRHDHAPGRPVNSADFKSLVSALRIAWGRRPTITAGLWSVKIEATWSRKRRLSCGAVIPYADVDAPISNVHDALEHAGIFDNDNRIDEIVARRQHDPERPGVLVIIERVA